MLIIAKVVIILFGVFLIAAGFLMLLYPRKAVTLLKKAGSTNVINYTEITLRMIPAIAMVIYADESKYPEALKILGWFMIATCIILYVVPRKIHHQYSLKWAEIIKPTYFQLISPFSMFFGALIIYTVL